MARIIVFGASGGTGRQIVGQALAAGHQVTAFVRRASPLLAPQANLNVFLGNVLEADSVSQALSGQQWVLSALGPAQKNETVCAAGTRTILAGMQAHGLRRLVALSAYGASDTRNGGLYARVVWWTLKNKMQDKEEMEALVLASGLDWTLIRPPALSDGSLAQTIRHGLQVPISLLSRVSRADVAKFMLSEAGDNHYLQQAPTITAGQSRR